MRRDGRVYSRKKVLGLVAIRRATVFAFRSAVIKENNDEVSNIKMIDSGKVSLNGF